MGFEQLFDQVRNTPLLILDDVDTGSGSPWAKEKLFQVVNHRFNASLPTVFTTTTKPQQLDERLATGSWTKVCRGCWCSMPNSAAATARWRMTRDRRRRTAVPQL